MKWGLRKKVQDFFTGLQFLTRIKIVKQDEWSPESFGRSVKFFPLIGAVIGFILMLINHLCGGFLPPNLMAAVLIAVEITITGGLHCDGLMDTADGIFSGRTRDRMLDIMKDSRVGANGVIAFSLLILIKWSLLIDMIPTQLSAALFVMPILSRLAMVMGITLFPYARPDGIGKAFALYAGKKAFFIAALSALPFVVALGKAAILATVAVLVCASLMSRYVTRILGGLTGDVYGAITELSEIVVLTVFMLVI